MTFVNTRFKHDSMKVAFDFIVFKLTISPSVYLKNKKHIEVIFILRCHILFEMQIFHKIYLTKKVNNKIIFLVNRKSSVALFDQV